MSVPEREKAPLLELGAQPAPAEYRDQVSIVVPAKVADGLSRDIHPGVIQPERGSLAVPSADRERASAMRDSDKASNMMSIHVEESSPRGSSEEKGGALPIDALPRPLRKKMYDSQIILGALLSEQPVLEVKPPLWKDHKFYSECIAELVGTFLLVLFGCGVLCSAITTGAQVGLWQGAVIWGIGLTLGVLSSASISGAHLNPAVTLALALFRSQQFNWRKLPGYWIGQFLGAFAAAGILYGTYNPYIMLFEQQNGIVRGEAGSEKTAMLFAEYFPNPALPFGQTGAEGVSIVGAVFIEGFGTLILMFCILAITDDRSKVFVRKDMAPFLIGLVLAALESIFAPLTQAGLNPARDFAPRLVACMAGWGWVAIPGPRNAFWVYIVGPLFGAPIACIVYDLTVGRPLKEGEPPKKEGSRMSILPRPQLSTRFRRSKQSKA